MSATSDAVTQRLVLLKKVETWHDLHHLSFSILNWNIRKIPPPSRAIAYNRRETVPSVGGQSTPDRAIPLRHQVQSLLTVKSEATVLMVWNARARVPDRHICQLCHVYITQGIADNTLSINIHNMDTYA